MEEVFADQAEGLVVISENEGEAVEAQATVTPGNDGQVVDSPAVASEVETQSEEKPVEKKPKADRRPYIAFLTEALEQAQDRKALLKTIMERWPTISKGGAQTFLTDMLNPKYSHFKDRPIVKLPDGKVIFKDKAPVVEVVQEVAAEPSPVEVTSEAATQEIPPEQPGE